MQLKGSVKIVTIAVLCSGFVAAPSIAATAGATAQPETNAGEHARVIDASPAPFDTDGDGTVSESEKAASGERYKKVTEAMAKRRDGAQQHAERMAKRDDLKAAKETGNESGSGAEREAVQAIEADHQATKEAVKSGEVTMEEAKSSKKDPKKWWQFWRSGS